MNTEADTKQYKDWDSSTTEEEVDQFQLLEDKIDILIEMINTLRSEKGSLTERLEIQDEKLADLTKQIENLKSGRDRARQRIVSLLEKIEQIAT